MYQNIISLLFQFIPESIALAFSAAVFLKVNIDRRVIFIGLTDAVAVYFIRMLPLTFGFHTILAIILFTVLLTLFYEEKVLDCFISILKSFILLSIFEFLTSNILVYIFNKPIREVIKNPLWKTIAMIPQIMLLFLVGGIILRIRQQREQ